MFFLCLNCAGVGMEGENGGHCFVVWFACFFWSFVFVFCLFLAKAEVLVGGEFGKREGGCLHGIYIAFGTRLVGSLRAQIDLIQLVLIMGHHSCESALFFLPCRQGQNVHLEGPGLDRAACWRGYFSVLAVTYTCLSKKQTASSQSHSCSLTAPYRHTDINPERDA